MNPKDLRYQLESTVPGHKGSRHTCPGCERPKQFTRYLDIRTEELLPDVYGICNNRDTCGYCLSPYHKSSSGLSYADEVYQAYRENRPVETRTFVKRTEHRPARQTPIAAIIYALPSQLVSQSMRCFADNQFARLLWDRLGVSAGNDLLQRFQIGTSAYWPGACVFWYIDELQRVRGGQVVLFDEGGHTVKRLDKEGNKKRCTTWVHSALAVAYQRRKAALPAWLTDYTANAPKSPIPFGLHQLATAPITQPVAIVEAPKTAVLCSACFPQFVWLAVGALDYLTVERVAPLRSRKIRLFPDTSQAGKAFATWSTKASQLNTAGFSVSVDTTLEDLITLTDEQRASGYDLADYLLDNWQGFPFAWETAAEVTAPPTKASPSTNVSTLVRLSDLLPASTRRHVNDKAVIIDSTACPVVEVLSRMNGQDFHQWAGT